MYRITNQGEQIKIDYAADEEMTEIRQVCMLEQPVCLVLISRMTLDLGIRSIAEKLNQHMRHLLPPSVTRTLCAELATPWHIDIIIRARLKKSSCFSLLPSNQEICSLRRDTF